MRIGLILALFCASLVAGAARADTTAVYKSEHFPVSMTVEIADNGNARVQMSHSATYGIVRDDIDYFVQAGSAGPIVDRATDLMAVQRELMAAFMAQKKLPDFSKDAPFFEVVPSGSILVNGRPGTAYALKTDKKDAPPHIFMVISKDPALRQLGEVMAKQFSKSLDMMDDLLGGPPPMSVSVVHALQSGAPLRFSGMDLATVSNASIDPKRFELPVPPETIDQLRKRMQPPAAPPTAIPPKP